MADKPRHAERSEGPGLGPNESVDRPPYMPVSGARCHGYGGTGNRADQDGQGHQTDNCQRSPQAEPGNPLA